MWPSFPMARGPSLFLTLTQASVPLQWDLSAFVQLSNSFESIPRSVFCWLSACLFLVKDVWNPNAPLLGCGGSLLQAKWRRPHKCKFRISKSNFQKRYPYAFIIRKKNKQLPLERDSFLWWPLLTQEFLRGHFHLWTKSWEGHYPRCGRHLPLSPELYTQWTQVWYRELLSSWWRKLWLWFMGSCGGFCDWAKPLTERCSEWLGQSLNVCRQGLPFFFLCRLIFRSSSHIHT